MIISKTKMSFRDFVITWSSSYDQVHFQTTVSGTHRSYTEVHGHYVVNQCEDTYM